MPVMVLPDTIWSFQILNKVLYLWQPEAPKKVLWNTFLLRLCSDDVLLLPVANCDEAFCSCSEFAAAGNFLSLVSQLPQFYCQLCVMSLSSAPGALSSIACLSMVRFLCLFFPKRCCNVTQINCTHWAGQCFVAWRHCLGKHCLMFFWSKQISKSHATQDIHCHL